MCFPQARQSFQSFACASKRKNLEFAAMVFAAKVRHAAGVLEGIRHHCFRGERHCGRSRRAEKSERLSTCALRKRMTCHCTQHIDNWHGGTSISFQDRTHCARSAHAALKARPCAPSACASQACQRDECFHLSQAHLVCASKRAASRRHRRGRNTASARIKFFLLSHIACASQHGTHQGYFPLR